MAYGSVLTADEDAPEARKGRGAFFTPPEMAEYLANWAILSRDDSILEPACGEAEFLIASFRRLLSLGASEKEASERISGYELHDDSAIAALARCSKLSFRPHINVGDFFRQKPRKKFDVVLGNPPYVRFQVLDSKQKDSFREVSSRTGYAISALASTWAPFVMHGASFLNKGGRLAFVLPAELLTVNYAASIRAFLLSEFNDITIVTFDRQVFPEVQEEVVLLLASGYHQGSSDFIKWRQASDLNRIVDAVDRDYYPNNNGERWTPGLVPLAVGNLLDSLDGNSFCRLGDWGRLALGTVTGNNKYFVLNTDDAKIIGLGESEVVRISPPGSNHLRKLSFTAEDYDNLKSCGKRSLLFYPEETPSKAARRYIDFGLGKEVDQGYKCRKRKPWWKVPLTSVPDAFVTYMNDYAPSVCVNEARVHCLNSVHGLTFADEYRELGRTLFALASINSVTLLSSELEGRAYGGGLLKVEPREATRLQVPSPELVSASKERLEAIIANGALTFTGNDLLELSSKVDEALFGNADAMTSDLLEQIRNCKKRLYERRRNRGRKQ